VKFSQALRFVPNYFALTRQYLTLANYSYISLSPKSKHRKGKARLDNIINSIRLNNEICVNVNQIAKQEIENIMSNPRMLLRLVLASLFESSRKYPGKFQTLYYNMTSHLSLEQILSQSFISHDVNQSGTRQDELAGMGLRPNTNTRQFCIIIDISSFLRKVVTSRLVLQDSKPTIYFLHHNSFVGSQRPTNADICH
jgi:hypothetical protein